MAAERVPMPRPADVSSSAATRAPQGALDLIKRTYNQWDAHNAMSLAASLAYYTVFALAPILLLITAVLGLFFGRAAVQADAMREVREMVGDKGADIVATMIQSAAKPGASVVATVVGVVTILVSATGVFNELQRTMNVIWDAPVRPGGGVMGLLRDRFTSFLMVLGIGFLLVLSLAATAVLEALDGVLERHMPGAHFAFRVANLLVSFGVVTVLFAMIFKVLPDVKIAWRDVWVGALATSVLFTLGKFLLGLYLGNGFSSSYGAAGSLAVLLAWVYYSAQILFFGAEFTHVYAVARGSRAAGDAGEREGAGGARGRA